MQPGTHRKLAYTIRSKTPPIRPRYGDPGELRKDELRKIARHLGVSLLDLRREIDDTSIHKKHLRWAIAREAGFAGEGADPVDFRERFDKLYKRDLIHALEEVADDA